MTSYYITESAVITGKHQTEVLIVHKRRRSDIFRNNQTDDDNERFIVRHFLDSKCRAILNRINRNKPATTINSNPPTKSEFAKGIVMAGKPPANQNADIIARLIIILFTSFMVSKSQYLYK